MIAPRRSTGLRFVALLPFGQRPDKWMVHAVHPDHEAAQQTLCGIAISGLTPRFQTINAGAQRACHACGERLADYRKQGRCP